MLVGLGIVFGLLLLIILFVAVVAKIRVHAVFQQEDRRRDSEEGDQEE